MKIPKNYQRILLHTGDWGVTIQGDTPLLGRNTKGYHHVEEAGLQALSPVTLMITLLLSTLKSGAKVQLIINIYKEKGIYLCENLFFLQYRLFNQPDS